MTLSGNRKFIICLVQVAAFIAIALAKDAGLVELGSAIAIVGATFYTGNAATHIGGKPANKDA